MMHIFILNIYLNLTQDDYVDESLQCSQQQPQLVSTQSMLDHENSKNKLEYIVSRGRILARRTANLTGFEGLKIWIRRPKISNEGDETIFGSFLGVNLENSPA